MKQLVIKSITINSLGVFKDSTTINLETTNEKPIVLIEGMNGCGKTTLLQMLQVGLYGEHISGVSKSGYANLITSLTRQDVIQNPSVTMHVLLKNGNYVSEYAIYREWKRLGKKFSECFSIFLEGRTTNIDSNQWLDIVNEYLPSELADLFFFDGEKIESMANPDRMPLILKQATEALLGVGEIDSIINDLLALERRTLLKIKKQTKDSDDDSESLQSKLNELDLINDDLARKTQSRGALLSRKDELIKEVNLAKSRSNQQGLGAFKRSIKLREKIKGLSSQLQSLKEERNKIVSSPLYPLSRYARAAEALFNEILAEEGVTSNKKRLEAIKHHDAVLSSTLKNKFPKLKHEIDSIFQQEYDALVVKSAQPIIYQQIDVNSYRIKIKMLAQRFRDIRNHIDNLQNEILLIQRTINESPAPEKVELLIKDLANKEGQLQRVNAEIENIGEESKSLYEKKSRLSLQTKNLQTEIKKGIGHRELKRYSLEAGERARGLLELYKRKLMKSKAEWLSSAIFNYFTNLLRKQGFIGKVKINSETFSVEIQNTRGESIPVERLSAGERQMLATALLRAIMSAKSAALPIIVDTPLARLDGTHRLNLVKNFYTKVSHQVLILSTDEEISGALQKAILPFIARSYRLVFNEDKRATQIMEL